MIRIIRRWLPWFFVLAPALLALAGCSNFAYIGQAALGQTRMVLAQEPIERVLTDPETDEQLRDALQRVMAMRDFAVEQLGMADVRGFDSFVRLGREFVVWNVVAAPEFALDPLTWCFPVAGCVAYRGYFRERAAERYAQRLRRRGFDVWVYGVSAYSTLGWFDDPVFDTWVLRDEASVAALLFHELAHQVLYVSGDTPLSEGFARVVEQEGVRRWLVARKQLQSLEAYTGRLQRDEQLDALLARTRERLAGLYAARLDAADMRAGKRDIFAALYSRYGEISSDWPQHLRVDALMRREHNNASLAAFASYDRWVPALREVLRHCGGELGCFYIACRDLARREPRQRELQLLEFEAAASESKGGS